MQQYYEIKNVFRETWGSIYTGVYFGLMKFIARLPYHQDMIHKYLNLANRKLKQLTRHRYTKIAIFCVFCLLIFYMRSGRNNVRITSAVKCKADIAKVLRSDEALDLHGN